VTRTIDPRPGLLRQLIWHLTGRRPGGERHRQAIGGDWEQIGTLQFDFMVSRGLEPWHYLLDIGCGPLRGGVRFIRYLEPGHYYGFDKEPSLIEAGQHRELELRDLIDRQPRLSVTADFDLSWIPPAVTFDFMLAQSVFTHLPPHLVELCLARVMPRLSCSGVFYATFKKADRLDLGRPHSWRPLERDRVKYPPALLEEMATRAGATVEHIGEWSHPGQSRMLAFRRR